MSKKGRVEYYEPETIEVRINDKGEAVFYLSTRDGWEEIGNELQMDATTYEIGTIITLKEPVKNEDRND